VDHSFNIIFCPESVDAKNHPHKNH